MQILHLTPNVDDSPMSELADRNIIRTTVNGSTEVWIGGIPRGTAGGDTVMILVVEIPGSGGDMVSIEIKNDVILAAAKGIKERCE